MSRCGTLRYMITAVIVVMVIVMAFGGDVPSGRMVTPFNFSDPTVWRASDGRWLAMPSGMKPLLASVDLLTWTDAGFDILTEKTRSELVARTVGDRDPTFGGGFWAPDIAKVGDKWILTVTLYGGSFHKCTIVSLVADAPEGPFEDPRVLVDAKAAHIADSIDPEIVCDGDRTYLFFGSQDGIFRLELTHDARAPLPGAQPVHVAGYRSGWNRETLKKGRYHHYEGVYLHRRGEWWYMFASGGGFRDHTYRVVVARAKTLDGPFLDRDGKPIREGFATTILSSGKSDRFYGPGHNGEIFTKEGRDWMFYHVHDRRMPLIGKYAPRPMAVQEIKWDADGWPYFKGGKPDLKDCPESCRAELTYADVASVRIDDAFWSPRYALWRGTTIPDVLEKLEMRSHVAANLELSAKGAKDGHRGAYFFDGLLCESLRGVSDYLAAKPDAALESKIDRFTDLIAAAQLPDGYLNTRCQIGDGDKRRWGDNGGFGLDQHEIYNAGCLIDAGIHYYRATGKAKLLGCAMRFANLLCDTMGPSPKRNLIPTHSLAEEAMLKLAWLLQDDPSAARKAGVEGRPGDYLALVRFWLDMHGHHCGEPDWSKLGWGVRKRVQEMTAVPRDPQWRPCWGDYQMDRVPLDEYMSIEGHAVRATLLCLGIATYAEAADDTHYLGLAKRFWDSMVGRKMYISGGVGADAKFEAFTPDYVLPPNAYLETCAAIGSAFFSARMCEITGDGKYMDEVERVAYNALLTSVGANGRTYTYQNPLNTDKGERWEWHSCPCCPPMFLKFTGALPSYIYARCVDGYAVNLFVGSETVFTNGAAGRVRLVQKTCYPAEGTVSVEVEPERPARFVLRMRVPGWARGVENPYGLYLSDGARRWSMALNGQAVEPRIENGYAVLDREWKNGDAVMLSLDVSERIVRARPEVKDVAGCIAHMKGPVLLAEENDRLIPYCEVANNGTAPHKVWLSEK